MTQPISFLAFVVAVYDAIKVWGNFLAANATFFECALFLLHAS